MWFKPGRFIQRPQRRPQIDRESPFIRPSAGRRRTACGLIPPPGATPRAIGLGDRDCSSFRDGERRELVPPRARDRPGGSIADYGAAIPPSAAGSAGGRPETATHRRDEGALPLQAGAAIGPSRFVDRPRMTVESASRLASGRPPGPMPRRRHRSPQPTSRMADGDGSMNLVQRDQSHGSPRGNEGAHRRGRRRARLPALPSGPLPTAPASSTSAGGVPALDIRGREARV